jgi:hypothetical protein
LKSHGDMQPLPSHLEREDLRHGPPALLAREEGAAAAGGVPIGVAQVGSAAAAGAAPPRLREGAGRRWSSCRRGR